MSTPGTITIGTTTVFVPKLCSEREPDGSWEDCTWAGGVMLANFMRGEDAYPSTRAEYQGLREAGTGSPEVDGKGNSIDDLMVGMSKRYGFVGHKLFSWADLAEWPAGVGGCIQGLYGALPARLRRTAFRGAHNIFAIRDTDSFAWFDPLGITGEDFKRATFAEVQKFFNALPGARMLVAMSRDAYRREGMIRFDAQRWQAPKGEPIYEFPNGPKVTSLSASTTLTTVGVFMDHVKDTSPYAIGGWRAVVISSIAIDGKSGVKIAAIKTANLKLLTTPATWDANIVKLLNDPTLLVGPQPAPTPDPTVVTAAYNSGVTAAANAALAAKK